MSGSRQNLTTLMSGCSVMDTLIREWTLQAAEVLLPRRYLPCFSPLSPPCKLVQHLLTS